MEALVNVVEVYRNDPTQANYDAVVAALNAARPPPLAEPEPVKGTAANPT